MTSSPMSTSGGSSLSSSAASFQSFQSTVHVHPHILRGFLQNKALVHVEDGLSSHTREINKLVGHITHLVGDRWKYIANMGKVSKVPNIPFQNLNGALVPTAALMILLHAEKVSECLDILYDNQLAIIHDVELWISSEQMADVIQRIFSIGPPTDDAIDLAAKLASRDVELCRDKSCLDLQPDLFYNVFKATRPSKRFRLAVSLLQQAYAWRTGQYAGYAADFIWCQAADPTFSDEEYPNILFLYWTYVMATPDALTQICHYDAAKSIAATHTLLMIGMVCAISQRDTMDQLITHLMTSKMDQDQDKLYTLLTVLVMLDQIGKSEGSALTESMKLVSKAFTDSKRMSDLAQLEEFNKADASKAIKFTQLLDCLSKYNLPPIFNRGACMIALRHLTTSDEVMAKVLCDIVLRKEKTSELADPSGMLMALYSACSSQQIDAENIKLRLMAFAVNVKESIYFSDLGADQMVKDIRSYLNQTDITAQHRGTWSDTLVKRTRPVGTE